MDQRSCPYCGEGNQPAASRCKRCNRTFVDSPTIVIPDSFTAVMSALSHRYELVAEIGQGGNATVYQAIQKNLDRKVALKVLLPHLVNDRDYLERFHLEARAIAKLRHPHIVTIYDEGSENDVHYIAMEFLDGKDLHHLLKQRGRLTVSEAVAMARCMASALDYAHSYGIVHRDVKSSNIIMTTARTAVLTDFGIAQADYSSVHTKVGSVMGTPEFMSPEQAGGRAVDSRSDIYSLGVVLYHTLSGRFPFKAANPISTIHKIVFEDPLPIGKLVKLPPSLEHAIDRCLVKDPAQRVQDGRELCELIDGKPARKASAPVESPAPKSGKARRPVLRVAFALTALCALTAAYFTWQRSAVADVPAQMAAGVQAFEPVLAQVPDVVGRTKEEAITILKKSGFHLGAVLPVAVPSPEATGKVESQRPARASSAKPGSPVHLFIASASPASQPSFRPGQRLPAGAENVSVTYKAVGVNPFDGFTLPLGIGILDFTGPGGKQTDLSEKLYEALSSANQSFRIFPFSTIRSVQGDLGLARLSPSSKEVLGALGSELSVDFVVTGVMSNNADSSFSMKLIRCAGGITVFSQQFRSSSGSRALNDAVQFLVKGQVPVYSGRF